MTLEYFVFGVAMTSLITGGGGEEVTEVFAVVGSQAVLPCKFPPTNSHPANVLWTKDDKGTVWRKSQGGLQFWGLNWVNKGDQRVRSPHQQYERGDYSLHITGVKVEDAGLFSCMMESVARVVKQQVMLRIIQVSVSPSVPMWESNFSISCLVTPRAPEATVRWTLNGRSSIDAIQISQVADGKSVVRGTASVSLAGRWTCAVTHKGKVGRASADLVTKGIMKPSRNNAKVYAALGSAATLPCVFSPGLVLSRSAVERLKPGSLPKPLPDPLPAPSSPPSPSSQFGVDRSAILKEVHLEDGGAYRCSGAAEGQTLARTLRLVVAKVDLSTPARSAGSVTMTCQLTDASEVTRYEWVQQTFDGNRTDERIHEGKAVTVDKTSGENQGEWTCRFYGKQGVLGTVTHRVNVMSGLSGQKTGQSGKTAAALGVSFFLVALLLVLMQAYRNHRRRKMILQYPTLETIAHRMSNEREERERKKREKK